MIYTAVTRRALRRHWQLYAMLVPIVVYFVLFSYYPLLRGLVVSLQEFRVIGNRPFVGLNNYAAVLRDAQFWHVLRNTVIIGGGILGFGFAIPIVVALALSEVARVSFRKFTQMAIYLPHLFSWVVVGGIWIHILSPDGGLVNELIKLFGGRPIPFFALDRWAKPLMIAAPIWKDMGFNAILYLAAIVGINPALYEAARIDGANRWRQVRHVTIPLLRPTMTVVLLLNLAGVLRIFDQIYVMRNGAIAREVDVLMTYVYDKGLVQFHMGFATAAAFVVIGATLALLYINDTAKYTLQIALSALIIESDATSRATFISPNVRMAGIVIALVPLIVIYPLAQKYFVEGVMLGSVKE